MVNSLNVRSDRLITERQKRDTIQEFRVSANIDQLKTEQKALWENRTADVIRNNRIKQKVEDLQARRAENLAARRKRLAQLLAAEQQAYEREMVEKEETPQQRMEKMAVRAYELKAKREAGQQRVVQEKLYQQWREGIDELRQADSKLFELQTLAARDRQVEEKEEAMAQEKKENAVFEALWQEGYMAKVEREDREREFKKERNEQAKNTLDTQLHLKVLREREAREVEAAERAEMRHHWAAQEEEAAEQVVRDQLLAREERKKMDEFAKIQRDQRELEDTTEKEQDRQFVLSVLAREKALAMQEEAEKEKARAKTIEFTEALKLEMARKAESEEQLIQMQHEEQERQWKKRYATWEKEELARRRLLEEVYADRAEQVALKAETRNAQKADILADRERIDAEVARLETIDAERAETEEMVRKRHQEELFRQMDYHQVCRHRELQQHAIEQRQAMVAEERFQRAMEAEKEKQKTICKEIFEARERNRETKKQEAAASASGLVAPWDK